MTTDEQKIIRYRWRRVVATFCDPDDGGQFCSIASVAEYYACHPVVVEACIRKALRAQKGRR